MKLSLDRVMLTEAVGIAGDMSKTWYRKGAENTTRTHSADEIVFEDTTGVVTIKRKGVTFVTRSFVGGWSTDDEPRLRKTKAEAAA